MRFDDAASSSCQALPVVARQHGVNHLTELELEEAPHLLLVARVGGEPLAAGSLRRSTRTAVGHDIP